MEEDSLKKLDLYEFVKPENGARNSESGIGATGIITPEQTIEVYNLKNGEQLHIFTREKIMEMLYGIKDYKEGKAYTDLKTRNIWNRVINITYVNQQGELPYVLIDIPSYINPYQYSELYRLCKVYIDINNTSGLNIGILITGYDPETGILVEEPNDFEIDQEGITFDNFLKNILKDRIKEYENNLPPENKLEFDENDILMEISEEKRKQA